MTFQFLNKAFKLFTLDYNAFKEIKSDMKWHVPFIFAWIVSIVSIVFSDITTMINRNASISVIFEISKATKYILYPLALIILTSTIVHLLMKIFGGKADFFENIKFNSTIIGIVTFITLVIVQPIDLIASFLNSSIQISLLTLAIVLLILIVLWSIFLSLKVFSNLYNISLVKTFFAIIIIPISLFVLLLILISIGILSVNVLSQI